MKQMKVTHYVLSGVKAFECGGVITMVDAFLSLPAIRFAIKLCDAISILMLTVHQAMLRNSTHTNTPGRRKSRMIPPPPRCTARVPRGTRMMDEDVRGERWREGRLDGTFVSTGKPEKNHFPTMRLFLFFCSVCNRVQPPAQQRKDKNLSGTESRCTPR